MKIATVVLAAGQGTRMRSNLPKILHKLGGRPLISHALETAKQATKEPPVVVVGHGADMVKEELDESIQVVIQEEQLGTGHAVQQTRKLLEDKYDLIVVSSADMPLLKPDTFQQLIKAQESNPGPITMLTLIDDNPRGFGRVTRNGTGNVDAIVEEAQATSEQLSIRELNVGVYCFSAAWLWENLPRIPLSSKGEYYLTDLVSIAVEAGENVEALTLQDPDEAIGINTRIDLADAEAAFQKRINNQWMLSGVTIIDPRTTYIESGVVIGQDTTLHPNTMLQGKTQIGEECQIGPNTIVQNTALGNRCRIVASVLENAKVEDDVDIGPFGHLRKGAHLGVGVHMGNFGEVKNSYLGPGAKVGHFSYVGDATIGSQVNIGAGTVTCNYDGKNKNHTEIEEGAFIGSDTMLVAPLKIGRGAHTGAGSVVTKDVPANTLVAGIPARAVRKLDKIE